MKKLSILGGLALALGGSAVARAQEPAPAAPTPAQSLPANSDEAQASPEAPAPAPQTSLPAEEVAAPVPEASLYGAPTDPAGAPTELTAAELEALGFGGGAEAPRVDTDLKIFGFIDFGTNVVVPKSSTWSKYLYPHRSFNIGNFNLYLSKNLSDRWRTMGEVRFLYLPNGSQTVRGTPPTYTLAGDYNDSNRALKWGGVEIERVYLEYSAFKYMTVRAGQFLTPYGIWNVDHGSPTYIPVARPYAVGASWFPERQTGFELFGRYDLSLENSFGYHVTLSNGQGITSEYRDLDNNKAVGARVYWDNNALGQLRVGASGFYGTLTDGAQTLGLSNGKLVVGQANTLQYHNLALAVDAQWKYKSLHLQAEWLCQQVDYTRNGRTQVPNAMVGETAFPADFFSHGMYFLAGYRLPWYGVMPYGIVQFIDQGIPADTLNYKVVNTEVGLNIRVIDPLVLKASYTYAHFLNHLFVSGADLNTIQAQAAWAF
jgi:Phosphate-selective porin O and P